MESFTFLCRTKTGFGMNALDHLPFDLSNMGAKKPFVLQDREAASSNSSKPLIRAFMESGMILGLCPPMNRDDAPGMTGLRECYQTFLDKGFDSIIALGTGYVVDMAKALNLTVSRGPEALKGLLNGANDTKPLLPFAYLPTGVGTGVETDCTARFDGRVFDLPVLAPDIAVIDQKIMAGDTLNNMISNALTSLSVCCETLVFSKNPPAKAYAATGIGLIMDHLFPLIDQTGSWDSIQMIDDKKDRYHLACLVHASAITGYLLANHKSLISYYLGCTIAKACTAAPGQVTAIVLPGVLEACAGTNNGFGDLLLALCGPDDFSAIPVHQQTAAAIHHLKQILNNLYRLSFGAIPRTLADTGMEKAEIDGLLESVFQEKLMDKIDVSETDMEKLKTVLSQS